MSRFFRALVKAPIVLYQRLVSPLMPPHCRYQPSCSHYSKEAVERHGAAKGLFLGLARILRCNGLFSGGWDPVPRSSGWRRLWRRVRWDWRRYWQP